MTARHRSAFQSEFKPDGKVSEPATARSESAAVNGDAATLRQDTVRTHIRGSGMLFGGRLFSKWLNFGVQVLVVRVLSQADFGALTYALSIVTLLEQVSTLGLDRSITRFVPIYQEQRDYSRLIGTVLMALGTVLCTGLLMAIGLHAGQTILGAHLISDQRALRLVLLLVFLVPVQAIDDLLLGMFAVFAHPGAIFFRRYVLAPGLKLVVLLSVAKYGVFYVATGYLASDTIGMTIGAILLWRFVGEQKLFEISRSRRIQFPWHDVFTFTIPLISTDLLMYVLPVIDVVLLGKFRDVAQVAAYRAVIPLVLLVDLVKQSFAPLFIPSAARMLARNDKEGINKLYWQTTIWITVLSFPVFLVTFSMAKAVTILLFGARYAGSADVLAVLSLGCFIDVATGFNALILKVYGRLRFAMAVNAAALGLNLALAFALIPRYGVMGAAIASSITWIVNAAVNQWGLSRGIGIRVFEPQFASVYFVIIATSIGILLIDSLVSPPIYISAGLIAAASLVVIRWSGHMLEVSHVFPELVRIPVLKRILGQ